ncbi:MAG: hypothetical protein ACOYUZ_05510 [Patescibacteria group bacterium]
MPSKQLTPEQLEKVKQIFQEYREKADKIIEDHHKEIRRVLMELDQKKMDELKKTISET